jgi:hypothetical protein
MKIRIRVPELRDRAALVDVYDGRLGHLSDVACASASRAVARRLDNAALDPRRPGGHPPFGSYLLRAAPAVPQKCELEYGGHLLLFEPESGDALHSESFGRLLLAVYAGPAGRDGLLRRTQGGVRLPGKLFSQIVASANPDSGASLTIEPLEPRWWQFWASAPRTPAISADEPHLTREPVDEASLIAELSRGLARRTKVARRTIDDDDDDDETWSDSSSSDSVQGRGGRSGGAGASGSWDDGPRPAAHPPGVTDTGRIVGVAAGAALGAAAAHAAADAPADEADAAADDRDSASSSGSGTESATSY